MDQLIVSMEKSIFKLIKLNIINNKLCKVLSILN